MALVLGWGAAVLFFRLATDMPVFIWKGLPSLPPNELAPLHHYAAAPLAYAPLVAAAVVGLPTFAEYVNAPGWFVYPLVAAWALVIGGWLYLCWRTPLALMRSATGCDRRQTFLLGAYLPVHALIMLVLSFLLFMVSMFPVIQLIEFLDPYF
jgi:hypothetical protein